MSLFAFVAWVRPAEGTAVWSGSLRTGVSDAEGRATRGTIGSRKYQPRRLPYPAATIRNAVRRASAISDSIGLTPDAVGIALESVT